MAVLQLDTFSFFERDKKVTPTPMTDAHYHPYYELYYLISGKITYFVDKKVYTLAPGDFILIPPNHPHQTSYTGERERVILIFSDNDVGEDLKPLLKELVKFCHIKSHPDIQYKYESILKKIESETLKHDENYRLVQILYLKLLIVLLSRYKITEQQKLKGARKLVQDAVSYMENNYYQELTLNSISNHLHVTPNYLSTQFKKITGVSATEYLNTIRINKAIKMLTEDAMNITDVALNCGYNSHNYFLYVFKNVIGTSPKKYLDTFKKKNTGENRNDH